MSANESINAGRSGRLHRPRDSSPRHRSALREGEVTKKGFGRAALEAAAEDGNPASFASFTIFSSRLLDGLVRIKAVLNPNRGPGATTKGWTRNSNDLSGRVMEVAASQEDRPPRDR